MEELIQKYRSKFLIAYTGEKIEELLRKLISEIQPGTGKSKELSPDLTVDQIADEGIKYLQEKYPDRDILRLPDIKEGGEFVDFAMGLQIGYALAESKSKDAIIHKQEELIEVLKFWFDTDDLADKRIVRQIESELEQLKSKQKD